MQFKDFYFRSEWGADVVTESASLQIRLYETSNKIEYTFDGWSMLEGAYVDINTYITLRGSESGDVVSFTGGWSEPAMQPGTTGTVMMPGLPGMVYSATSAPAG